MKLNGWQRAWVLLSMLYLIVVAIFSYSIYQDNIEYLKDKERKIVSLINKENEKNKSGNGWTEYTAVSDIKNLFGNSNYPSREDIEDSINSHKKGKKLDFSEIENTYKMKIFYQRLRHIISAFLLWGIPSMFLYILGYGVGWVIRGFKKV